VGKGARRHYRDRRRDYRFRRVTFKAQWTTLLSIAVIASLGLVTSPSEAVGSASWLPTWAQGAPEPSNEQVALEQLIRDFLNNDYTRAVDNGCADSLDDYSLALSQEDAVDRAYDGILSAAAALGNASAIQAGEVATRAGVMIVQLATFAATLPAKAAVIALAEKSPEALASLQASETLKQLTNFLVAITSEIGRILQVVAQGSLSSSNDDVRDLTLSLAAQLQGVISIGSEASKWQSAVSGPTASGILGLASLAQQVHEAVDAYEDGAKNVSLQDETLTTAEGLYALALAKLEITVNKLTTDAAACKAPKKQTPCKAGSHPTPGLGSIRRCCGNTPYSSERC